MHPCRNTYRIVDVHSDILGYEKSDKLFVKAAVTAYGAQITMSAYFGIRISCWY